MRTSVRMAAGLLLLLAGCSAADLKGGRMEPTSITISKSESYLSELRPAPGALRDFQKKFLAARIEPGRHSPVAGASAWKAGGRPLLWLAPDKGSAVVDGEFFSDLLAVDATNLAAGEKIAMGRWLDLSFRSLAPRDVVLFLLKGQIIQAYVHVEARLQRDEEEDGPARYRAGFSGSHIYFTNERNEDRLAFAVEIDKKTGEISVTGR